MREHRQEKFSREQFDDSRFNIHTHAEGRAEVLVILLHGLSGRGYETWGELPSRLFDGIDGPAVDVGIYDYVSGARRVAGKATPLNFRRQQVLRELRHAADNYSYIFLMGHSLGGVLAEAVAVEFVRERALHDPTGKADVLAAVVLFAAPRAGSGLAVPALSWLMPDFKDLKRLSKAHAEVDSFLTTHTECRNVVQAAAGQRVLPRFGVVGGSDRVVSSFSSAFGIPETQILPLTLGHSAVAKPPDGPSSLMDWLHSEVFATRIEVLTQARRQRKHDQQLPTGVPQRADPSLLVTEFSSDSSGLQWEEVYAEALLAANTAILTVRDVRDVRGVEANLRLAVHDAARVISGEPSVALNMKAIETARVSNPRLAVGVSAVGQDHQQATEILGRLTKFIPVGNSFYIEGATDRSALRQVLARFIYIYASRPRIMMHSRVDGLDHGLSPFTDSFSEGAN